MVAIIAGAAILHGLRIVGLRIIPYLVREGTRIAAKQTAKQVTKSATRFQPAWKRNVWTGGSDPVVAPVASVAKEAVKKVGAKKITETGYIVVVSDPKKYTLAQKIFGKRRVFKSDVLSAESTSSRTYEHITKESLKKIKDSSIKRTIASQADDAANGVSKFIIQSPTRVTRGENVVAPFNKFFGQNIKFTDKTLKNIKLAETGPTALGKEIITTGVAKKTAEEVVKAPVKTVTQKIVKAPEIKKNIGTTVGKSYKPTSTEVVPTTQVVDKPWYVAVMPRFLRTSKETVDTSVIPYVQRTTHSLTKAGKVAATAGTVGASFAIPAMIPSVTDKPEKRITTDLNIDQLFGDTTGPLERTQLDVPQSVEIFDD